MKNALTGIFLLICTPFLQAQLTEDPPKDCRYCEAWNQHQEPYHVYGNTWYVGTTWTWQSCEQERCLDVVYADSLSAVSAEGFRVTDPSRTPTVAEQITASAQLVRELDCDVLLAPHPFLFQMPEKLEDKTNV